VRAYALAQGHHPSEIASCEYVIDVPGCIAAPPEAQPSTGTYSDDFVARLQLTTAGTIACYTLDGSTPTSTAAGTCTPPALTYDSAKGIPIDGTVTVGASGRVTLNAIATAVGTCSGGMFPVSYTLQPATPVIAPAGGKIAVGSTVSFTTTTKGAVTFRYTTDGTDPSCASTAPKTGASFVAAGTEAQVKVVACKAGYADSLEASAAYTF